MATGEKKTQDIQKATEVLLTDLLLATTNPASGNPENKNQCGKETGAFTREVQTKTVKFPREMLGGSTPAIIVTVGGGSAWTKVVHVNASTVDKTGFDLNFSSDSGSGNISVSWAAFGRE